MFIGGISPVPIGQASLNDVTNADYVELIVVPHQTFSFITESITSLKLN